MKNITVVFFTLIVIGFLVWWFKTPGIELAPSDIQMPTTHIVPKPALGGDATYTNTTLGFTIHYPDTFLVDENYTYTELGAGKDIHGVALDVPEHLVTGTNLSDDTKITIEWLPYEGNCSAQNFLPTVVTPVMVTDGSATYSMASTSGAAAGNIYEEIVYAFPQDKVECFGVRYFIHSGNIGNYPPGAVRAFDRAALLRNFDAIRESFSLNAVN